MTTAIDYINNTQPTVDYRDTALADNNSTVDTYREKFERAWGLSEGDDIGGLIVYNDGEFVYDYENYVGWQRA